MNNKKKKIHSANRQPLLDHTILNTYHFFAETVPHPPASGYLSPHLPSSIANHMATAMIA